MVAGRAMVAVRHIPRAALVAPLALILAAAWPGCDDPPPRERDAGPRAAEPAAPPVAEEAAEEEEGPPPGVDHTIQEGQTLWQIARAYGVTVPAIMEANHLRPRDVGRLRAGNTLRIPGATEVVQIAEAEPEVLPPITDGAYHRLAEGETLWDVARLYDVSLDALTERNQLDDEGVRQLRPGRAVIVPGATEQQVERVTREREREPPEARERRGFRHTVSRGETIWDLAAAFGVPAGAIMTANGLDEAGVRNLREGARLYIPGVEQDRGGRVRRQLSGLERRALALAQRLGLGTRQAARSLLHGRVDARWARAASRGQNRMPGSLRWPLANGWFVRGYGSGEGGYHLAVDIMGRIGWNVRAAAPGIVGYAGDEVPGYGNIVLLVHPGGWVTMYAHNSANLVVAGQYVPRGGIIAEVGSTGISRGPHVHFEFIYDGQNCDPATLFRPGIRHRDGHLTPLRPQDWLRPRERPEGMRCHPRRLHPRSRWVVHESFDENERGDE